MTCIASLRASLQLLNQRFLRGVFVAVSMAKTLVVVSAILFLSFDADVRAETDAQTLGGKHAYLRYCASCHGENAKGGGPAASAFHTPPPDLTKLAKRAGVFDKSAVLATIDGRSPVAAHGSREMPVWGAIFEDELREEGKKYPVYMSLIKSTALVDYLHDIQE